MSSRFRGPELTILGANQGNLTSKYAPRAGGIGDTNRKTENLGPDYVFVAESRQGTAGVYVPPK